MNTNLLVRCHTCLSSHVVSVNVSVTKQRQDFACESCQICARKTALNGDGFLRGAVALMAVCR